MIRGSDLGKQDRQTDKCTENQLTELPGLYPAAKNDG